MAKMILRERLRDRLVLYLEHADSGGLEIFEAGRRAELLESLEQKPVLKRTDLRLDRLEFRLVGPHTLRGDIDRVVGKRRPRARGASRP